MRDRPAAHDAVRSLLTQMHMEYDEIPENRKKADFCGKSLYRPQVPRNPALAPIHYKEHAEGLFLKHTEEKQHELMIEYCKHYKTDQVVCYCYYCLEGLLDAGVEEIHLAELLFPLEKNK